MYIPTRSINQHYIFVYYNRSQTATQYNLKNQAAMLNMQSKNAKFVQIAMQGSRRPTIRRPYVPWTWIIRPGTVRIVHGTKSPGSLCRTAPRPTVV